MILIIESGASKTHWRLIKKSGAYTDIIGSGFNITQQSIEQLDIPSEILMQKSEIIESYSFIAGFQETHHDSWQSFISKTFKNVAKFGINHDLMASCLSTAGQYAGIICNLGTGSNACYYNGNQIIEKVESLGYILGDEGSGFHIGKLLLNDFYNGRMPDAVSAAFKDQNNLTKSEVLEKVYRSQNAKYFVAGFAKFLNNKKDDYALFTLNTAFNAYLGKYIAPLYKKHPLPLYFTGSIAEAYKNQLKECCSAYHMKIAKIVRQPMDNLSIYYQNKT